MWKAISLKDEGNTHLDAETIAGSYNLTPISMRKMKKLKSILIPMP